MDEHLEYSGRALELAAKARGATFPNPLVGAVIVSDNRIVGEGFHRRAGGPHAEVEAIASASGRTQGATLYLNLEPCCHCGKTGPCTEAIIEAGISRVVFSIFDPDPRVKGQGAARLRESGIEVVTGIREAEAVELNLPFIHSSISGRPLIVLKLALTLDGKLTVQGRDWLTGPEAGKYVHTLRGSLESIAVGSATIRKDTPLLDRRLLDPDLTPPVRMVFDSSLQTPPPSQWDTGSDRVIYFCSDEVSTEKKKAFEEMGVEVATLPGSEAGVDLKKWPAEVASMGISSVLVEGGGRVASSLIEGSLVDRLVLIHAPLLGGKGGVEWYRSVSVPEWPGRDGLFLSSTTTLGNDSASVYDTSRIRGYAGALAAGGQVEGV